MKDEFTPISIKIEFRFRHPSKGSDMNFYQCKDLVNKIAEEIWESKILDLDKLRDQLIGISINRANSHPGTFKAKVR